MRYDGQPSRMTVKPVLKSKKMDFGCGVVHDQERCILCARCVRFTRMITKTGELGIVNRTDYARVNIFPGRPLNNRYALNVVDLCPVGAMTSRDFRFKQRSWFLTKSKSICHGCSKGCNIFIDHNREKYKDDIIYRFRPRLNEKVNGYFMCDEGRMTYKLENDNRLTTATIEGRAVGFNEAIEAIRREISQATKGVVLVSPNASLEQMYALQQFAGSINAQVSGYSEGYIKAGDGDDFLIQDDKSANRASLALLGIDDTKAGFDTAINGADLLLSFQNTLSLSFSEDGLNELLASVKLIALDSSFSDYVAKAAISAPIASFSEDTGSIINCDGRLQRYEVAVVKNQPACAMIEAIHLLGGAIKSNQEARAELQTAVAALQGIDLDQIPAEGIALTESEVAHVAA